MSHIVKIISKEKTVTNTEYHREFTSISGNLCDFSFPCEENGTLIPDEYYEIWIKNYKYCISHPDEYKDEGIVTLDFEYKEPAHVKCSCGNVIILKGEVKCAGCGQWYNEFGQRILNPEEWIDE